MESDSQTANVSYASHGRPPNRIAGARRQMQTRGISPRPAYTEYYQPMGRDEAADVLPPLEISGLPSFSLGDGVLPSLLQNSEDQGENSGAFPFPDATAVRAAPSPSVMRSPTERRPSAEARGQLEHPNSAASALAEYFESLALTPYRTIVFRKTGDELVLATTIYSHRVAVYVPRERAVPLRKMGTSLAVAATDFVSEHTIVERDDLNKYGASELCYAAGTAAAEAEVSAYSHVFGVLTASSNPQNPKSARYFALLCRVAPSEASSLETPTDAKAAEIDVHIYAETEAATHEFRNRHRHALFARAQAVIPIVHISTIERESAAGGRVIALADCVHAATRRCESSFTEDVFFGVDSSVLRRLDRIRAVTQRLRDIAPECSRARARETDAALASISRRASDPGEPTDKSLSASHRVRELALYSVHLQETIGAYVAQLESSLSEAEAAAESALANLYSETRIAICPDPVTRAVPLAKAETWGYDAAMDALSVTDPPSAEAFLAPSDKVPPHVATAMRCLVAAREAAE